MDRCSCSRCAERFVEAEVTIEGRCAVDVACEQDGLRRSKEGHVATLPLVGDDERGEGGHDPRTRTAMTLRCRSVSCAPGWCPDAEAAAYPTDGRMYRNSVEFKFNV